MKKDGRFLMGVEASLKIENRQKIRKAFLKSLGRSGRSISFSMEEQENIEDLGGGQKSTWSSIRGDVGAVVPIGNVEDYDVHKRNMQKPLTNIQSRERNPNSARGEVLTSEKAIEFMIHERQLMDQEQAILRRENEKLRDALEQQKLQLQNQLYLSANSSINESVKISGKEATKSHNNMSDAEILAYKKEIEAVKAENQKLRMQFLENEQTISSVATPIMSAETKPSLVQRGPLFSKSVTQNSNNINNLPILPSLLWEGGFLWKIPYNGKGSPERRIVMLKKATTNSGNDCRQVRLVYSDNSKSDATAYIAYPPTLIWFHGDKTSELGRELVLFDESKVVSGHSTPAFWKLANRNGQLPRHELCFSVISTTRSLDCAAESPSSANEWKEGLETFLNSIFNRNDSKYINNNDEYSDIYKPPPPMLPPPGYRQNKSKNVAPPPPPPPPPPPVAEDPFKQEILLKQLFVASHTGNNALLQEVLGQGINVNSMEAGTSDTPLMIACRKGDAVGVKICLEFGARNDPHPEFGQTALHAGVDECQYDAISVLLAAAAESEADHIICNLADPKGQTPLHLAVIRGSMSIIELLITHGADIARIDDIGQTCLHLCCELGFEQILALLLDHGGDFLLEQPDRDGNTPLHIASLYGFFPCVKLLLETAAEVMAVNRKGLTPYNLASSRGHHQVGLLLLEYQGHHNTASTVSTAATTNTMHNNYYTTQNTKQPVVNNTIFTGGQFSPIASRPYVPPEVEGMHNFSVDVREPPSTYKYNDGSPVVIRKVNRVSNLPRPHTSPNVVNKVNNTNTTMTTSPVVNHKVSTGALSARTTADYNTETIGSKMYSPLSARERPAPSLFETTTATTASSMSPLLREQGISSRPRTSSSNMTLNNPSAYYESNNLTVSSPVASPVSSPVFINPITMTVTNNNVTTNISDSPAVYDAKYSYDEFNHDNTTTAQYEYSQPIETFHHIGRTWSSYYSEEGYVYYLDTNSEHSQWEDPRTHGFILQITTEDASIARQLSPPKCPSPKIRSPASEYNNYSNNFNFDDEKLSVSKQLFNHDDDSKRSSKEAHSKEEVDEKHADVPAPPPPTDGSKSNGDVAAMLSLLQKFNLDISIPIKAEEKKEIDDTSGGNPVKEYGSKADVNIAKYQKMISLGCGLDNVVTKMKADGVATYLIDQFYRENTENTAV